MLSNCCNIKVQVYGNIGPKGTAFYEYIDKRWMDQMSGLTTPWAILSSSAQSCISYDFWEFWEAFKFHAMHYSWQSDLFIQISKP